MPARTVPLYQTGQFQDPIEDPQGRFMIYFSSRNSKSGPGHGRSGLRNASRVLAIYRQALALAFDDLIAVGLVKPKAPIRVYLADPMAVTRQPSPGVFPEVDVNKQTFPILLPTVSHLQDLAAEEYYFRSLAVHEMTHSLCFCQKGFRRVLESGPWTWWSEATAVCRELVAVRNAPPFEFLPRWCDRPEESLVKEPDWYGAGVLALYVDQRFGTKTIATLWRDGKHDRDPWSDLILRTDCPELFLDYCCDSYFYDQPIHSRPPLLPNVFERLDLRAWSRSFHLAGPDDQSIEETVSDFACRYYAVHVNSASASFNVEFVAKKGRPCARLFARSRSGAPTGPTIALASTQIIEASHFCDFDHFVIAVANNPAGTPTDAIPSHTFQLKVGLA